MKKCRKFLFASVAGLGASFCFVAGKKLDVEYSLDLMQKKFYIEWLICSILLGVIIHLSWELCNRALCKTKGKVLGDFWFYKKIVALESKLSFLVVVTTLLLLWIPAWLAIFPGVFSYDAYDEWMQICTGNITAHHPVLHVLFLGGIVEGSYQTFGNYNLGIAICTAIQLLTLAAVFAYTIQFMRERGVNPIFRLFALLFFGCSPVIQLFAICGTKDIFFSAAFLLFFISVHRICTQQESFWHNTKWIVVCVGSSIFTMIMRNNGLYIVIVTLFVMFFWNKKYWKKYLCMCGTVAAIYMIYIGPFYNMLGVTAGGVEEMLSVPLQQIARVYQYEKDSFSEEELEYVYSIAPQENWESYRSTVSDFVKAGFRGEVFREDPRTFFRFWFELGKKHPLTYVNSFLIGSVDFWYPFSVIDGYQDAYGKSSYFDYKVSEPGTEVVLLPGLHEVYEAISHDKSVQTIPGMFLILNPGWYLMLFLILFLYLWREKRFSALVPLLTVLLNFATVLLGPIALVRYVLILYFVFPIYCVLLKDDSR